MIRPDSNEFYELLSGDWEKSSSYYVTVPFSHVVWANFDLLNEDGSVYLAASDPVLPGYAIISRDHYKAACDAIRAKTGKTDLIKSGDMASEIASVPTYLTVETEEQATDTAAIPIVDGQVIVVTGA